MRRLDLCLATLLLVVVAPRTAHAYLDPGTGSLVLQAVTAALFGAMFAIKVYWQRIRSFFSRLRGRPDQPRSDED